MKRVGKIAAAVLALAGTVAAAAPAAAHPWGGYGGGYRHHDDTGTAIIAGIAGLGIGAALASGGRHDYYEPRYGYAPSYGYGYERPYGDYPVCVHRWRYDPYSGGSYPVRICR